MKTLIVYCHPSENSFTREVRDAFIRGLKEGGHCYQLSDLYQMGFQTDLSEEEYLREGFYQDEKPISEDVKKEQEKIQWADSIAFIYPVFWTEAPAKLVGWFQRVWTYGFAYHQVEKGLPQMKQLERAVFLVTMGADLQEQGRKEEVEAMETVMLEDRINWRAKQKDMIIFEQMTRGYGNEVVREKNRERYLKEVYWIGRKFGEQESGPCEELN